VNNIIAPIAANMFVLRGLDPRIHVLFPGFFET
jgi:hypothetical protein